MIQELGSFILNNFVINMLSKENYNRLTQIINAILGLSREKKKDLIKYFELLFTKYENIENILEKLLKDAPDSYDTLKEISDALVLQSDWNQSDENSIDFIKNKPTIPAAQIQSDWNEDDNESCAFIKNKPIMPVAQIQSDWDQIDNSKLDFIKNKPFYYDISFSAVPPDEINPNTHNMILTKDDDNNDYLRISLQNKNTNNISVHNRWLKINKNDSFIYNNETYFKIDIFQHASNSGDQNDYLLSYKENDGTLNLFSISNASIPTAILSTYNFVDNSATITSFGTGTKYNLFVVFFKNVMKKQLDIKYIPDSLIQRIEALEQYVQNHP